jgi:hypothetical protein
LFGRVSEHIPEKEIMRGQDRLKGRDLTLPPVRVPAFASGAAAVGALALGALAVGALAIGALAIGRLSVRRADMRKLHLGAVEIDDLVVHRLHVVGADGEDRGPEA